MHAAVILIFAESVHYAAELLEIHTVFSILDRNKNIRIYSGKDTITERTLPGSEKRCI